MLTRQQLEVGLARLQPPTDQGAVRRIVARGREETRQLLDEGTLSVYGGLEGDRWASGRRKAGDQVTLMRYDVAELMREGQEVALLGDNLFATLDTSAANLPPGTLVQVGSALCRVTPKSHNGCKKFAARVGDDAWEITAADGWRQAQLRGVHLQVLETGRVTLGCTIRVLDRPAPPPSGEA